MLRAWLAPSSHISWWPNHIRRSGDPFSPILTHGSPLDYFASGRNYSMTADYEIGLVPPLSYFASGGNYPIIRIMQSEWLPSPYPCSHICLCPNRIDSFENINIIFDFDLHILCPRSKFACLRPLITRKYETFLKTYTFFKPILIFLFDVHVRNSHVWGR